APLEQARVHWSQPADGRTLGQSDLNSGTTNERDLFSQLQAVRLAFDQVTVGLSEDLPLVPPLDADGNPVPPPDDRTVYKTRQIAVSGPLRSVSVLPPLSRHIGWRRAAIA